MARDFIMAKVFRRRRSDGIEVDTRNPITSRIHKYCTAFDTINSLAAIYNDIMENQYQSAMLALSNSQPNNASNPSRRTPAQTREQMKESPDLIHPDIVSRIAPFSPRITVP
jgi:hypothetical protein